MFSSMIFKIKLFNPKAESKKYETLYWVNFRLFEHTRALKTGKNTNLLHPFKEFTNFLHGKLITLINSIRKK